jgi:hypothetical protein
MSARSICCRCKRSPVEVIDDWESTQCPACNDRDIERNREREEWNHFHPDFLAGPGR